MSEQQPEGGGYAGGEESHITSMADIGERLTRIEQALSGGAVKASAPEPEKDASIEERVRAEIARGQEEEARKQAQSKAAADKQAADNDVRARLAKLEEKPPAEPRGRLKSFITKGWV